MSLRRGVLWIAGLACLAAAGVAPGEGAPAASTAALPPVIGATEFYHSDEASGLAVGGLDPVTYFLPEGPKPGRADLEFLWSGVAWRFASAANRAAFEASPTSYAPRMGGYDAEAISRGRIVDANPRLYLVRDDRLYLFRNDASRARFLADEALAARSEASWQALAKGLVQP
jgi:hypothetical protein